MIEFEFICFPHHLKNASHKTWVRDKANYVHRLTIGYWCSNCFQPYISLTEDHQRMVTFDTHGDKERFPEWRQLIVDEYLIW